MYTLEWLDECRSRETGELNLAELSPRIKILDRLGCRVSARGCFEPDTLIGRPSEAEGGGGGDETRSGWQNNADNNNDNDNSSASNNNNNRDAGSLSRSGAVTPQAMLFVEPGCVIKGGVLDVSNGDIFLGGEAASHTG